MNRSWLRVIARLALTFGTVYGRLRLAAEPVAVPRRPTSSRRSLNVLGVDRVRGGYGNQILVMPADDHAVPREHQPVVLGARRGAGVRRHLALPRPRRAAPALRRLRWRCGPRPRLQHVAHRDVDLGRPRDRREHGLVVFHDWVGTVFGLLYVLGGFTLFLFLLLPSNKQLLKEAANGQLTPPPSCSIVGGVVALGAAIVWRQRRAPQPARPRLVRRFASPMPGPPRPGRRRRSSTSASAAAAASDPRPRRRGGRPVRPPGDRARRRPAPVGARRVGSGQRTARVGPRRARAPGLRRRRVRPRVHPPVRHGRPAPD